MASAAAAGLSALESKDYPAAIKHYTTALLDTPTSPIYLIKRSTAYQRSSPPQYKEALQDAEAAVVYASERGKRELIASAQMRRGIALFGLQRWPEAAKSFEWAKAKNPKEQGLDIWRKKVDIELQRREPGAVPIETSIREFPTLKKGDVTASESLTSDTAKPVAPAIVKSNVEKVGVQTPANKIRHEWYQTSSTVVVTLFVRGATKDETTIDIREQALSISFPLPSSSNYDLTLDPLYAPIDVSQTTCSVMSTKIEITLQKSVKGQKWGALEGGAVLQSDSKPLSPEEVKSAIVSTQPRGEVERPAAPAYPTSSRSGPKNWDKVAADLTKKPRKSKDEQEIGKGKDTAIVEDGVEDDLDDEGGDPVNAFFKKLYAGADPDTRRAMMKSYQESNGTALSTNWSEVGARPVETSPPDGMEAKKW
ncbi:MAG: hypothetical protein M1825_001793 [Sarcosagium campestre]|nr:MAG: hypothetical protein M1825_001793 [Sarcosagium campestre]